jgi:hypothetical protein
VFGAGELIPNFVAGVEMAQPFGFETSTRRSRPRRGARLLHEPGVTPRFTTWCPEPTTPLGRDNPDGAPLEYHVRLLGRTASARAARPRAAAGYGEPGAGNAVFSVSSFMDVAVSRVTVDEARELWLARPTTS